MTFRTFRIGGPHRAWQPGLYAGLTRERWHLTRTASPGHTAGVLLCPEPSRHLDTRRRA
jgi:hypothetical protein